MTIIDPPDPNQLAFPFARLTPPPRPYGVEIECVSPDGSHYDHSSLANALARDNIRIACGQYTSSRWGVKGDGSITSPRGAGAEIVSPPLTGSEGLEQIALVARALRLYGCGVNRSCGLHVHVSVGDLSERQLGRVAAAFLFYETVFDSLVPKSRRRNNYCMSNRTAANAWARKRLHYLADTKAPKAIHYLANDATTISSPVGVMTYNPRPAWNSERRRKLNLYAVRAHGTVEFRQHSGTLDGKKITMWVRLVTAFVEKGATFDPDAFPAKRSLAGRLAQMLDWLDADHDLRAYLTTRQKLLADVPAIVIDDPDTVDSRHLHRQAA